MSLLDRFLLAFKRDLFRASPQDPDHYVRLYWEDREAFYAALAAAWSSGLPEPFISIARVQAMNEDLGPKGATRLARNLLLAERHEEAAQVLRDPPYRLESQALGQLDLACAFLGLGRLQQAALALRRATEKAPALGAAAQALRTSIDHLATAEAAARRSKRWSEAAALIELWLQVGAVDPARRALQAFATTGALWDAPQHEAFHGLLDTIVSLAPASDLHTLFRSLEPLFPDVDARADLARICRGLCEPSAPGPWRSDDQALRASGALAWGRAGRLSLAIRQLGKLSSQLPRESHIRAGLARFVGEDVLRTHPLALQTGGPRKIFDVFPFNDELKMLEIKLHEMAGWVDHFVLVEARQTFTGAQKPLVFQENQARFAAFGDKIIHVVVDAFPPHVRYPWAREFHQRDMGVLGLIGRCSDEDLVIISDTDEIIFRSAVEGFTGQHARLAMERARYFFNYREALPPDQQKDAASLWRAGYLRAYGLSYARTVLRFDKKAPRLTGAGWHFTSIADAEGIAAKLRNTAHQEYADIPRGKLAKNLRRIRAGEWEEGWERCDLDDRFPAYIRRHQAELAEVLL